MGLSALEKNMTTETTQKRQKGFRKTDENGVRDPNIKVGPREPKKMTKRAIKDRELMSILRRVKPHLSDAIMTAANIMKNEEANDSNKLRAAVILLDAYRQLTTDIYAGKDQDEGEGTEVQPQQEKTVAFSLRVVNQE